MSHKRDAFAEHLEKLRDENGIRPGGNPLNALAWDAAQVGAVESVVGDVKSALRECFHAAFVTGYKVGYEAGWRAREP